MSVYFFRSEPGAAELRRLARGESGRVCQRVLMIANMLEGMEHEEAARLAGLSRSAAYEWHNRYEEGGIEGLRDRPRPGRQPRVDAVTSARFKERMVAGAALERDGVVAFRGVDAQRILKEEFEIDCSLSSTYRLLHRIKLSWHRVLATRRPMRRRKRRFRNAWIAIRASPGGARTRHASRGVVSGRGSHRPEEQSDPGVGANRANEPYMGLSASGSNTKTQSTLSDFPESPLMHRQPGGCRVWRQPNRRKLDHRRRFTQTRCLAVHTLWRARSVWCAGAFRLYSGNQGSPLCGKVADHTAAP
jgi:transposase